MFTFVTYNNKSIKFAKIANNDIKFVTLKTILNNKDKIHLSYGLHLETRFLKLVLKNLAFKEKVVYNIWFNSQENRPNVFECLEYLVSQRYISAYIKGTKLN